MRRLLFALLAASSVLGLGRWLSADVVPPATADEQLLQAAKIGTDGPALLAYLKQRTTPRADAAKIKTLIQQLGDDSFAVRQEASAELVRLAQAARPYLEQAVKDDDVERARRAAECLAKITTGGGVSTDAAAVRLAALRKPNGAAEVLLAFLPSAVNEVIVAETQDALTALAVRDGKAEPALLAGLQDQKEPLKRAGAAVALCRAGAADAMPAVRALLADPEAAVRLQVGLALAAAGEKAALPVLIDLLADLPRAEAWQVEDVLVRLGDGRLPPALVGTDAVTRKRCRDAWAKWWAAHGDKVKLEVPAKPLGHTLLLLLDANAPTGTAREVDIQGKTLWEITDIEFPLDAQPLPGDRLLLAENGGKRVTERDRKGMVVWEKPAPDGLLAAQRLANGNTFLVSEAQLVEIDRDGKEVWSHARPDGKHFSKAQKMPNGDVVCTVYNLINNTVRTDQQFLRLSPDQKELCSFRLDVNSGGIRTSGGRIDVLPNGHVLVPLMDDNKVVEYDADGHLVWEAGVEKPIAAVRLPNGHTLVTIFTDKRAVELDRAGREVWEYKGDVRVTRAWRR